MLKAMEKRNSHVKNYHSFQVLPERVKSKLNISPELFKKVDISLVIFLFLRQLKITSFIYPSDGNKIQIYL